MVIVNENILSRCVGGAWTVISTSIEIAVMGKNPSSSL
jgi:hypothetical protein